MAEWDFDDVTPKDEGNSRAFIRVGLRSFRSWDEVDPSFPSGELKISATVDGKVYSKTIKGLTNNHVDVVDTQKSSGSFTVILQKKQPFSLEALFYKG